MEPAASPASAKKKKSDASAKKKAPEESDALAKSPDKECEASASKESSAKKKTGTSAKKEKVAKESVPPVAEEPSVPPVADASKKKKKKAEEEEGSDPSKKKKRRVSAYQCFSAELKQNSTEGMTFKDWPKYCADKWKEVEDKGKYEAMANEANGEPEGKKKKKSDNPPSAFIAFSMAERAKMKEEDPTLSFGDLSKKCSAKWKEMSDEEKAAYKA